MGLSVGIYIPFLSPTVVYPSSVVYIGDGPLGMRSKRYRTIYSCHSRVRFEVAKVGFHLHPASRPNQFSPHILGPSYRRRTRT
ncbi:hypothetical protein BDV40DRAFT_263223 [Aspergillus tamarii]|uniref:Uncharacterized protein n=1 Tax=Aspergillus tamarii TaxID=41984 RepID=A0A5N6UX71_ASPTM|nr:hypothetical protein BDV40DRAFT_263223 [Aspergillus tamarii]